MSGEHEHHLRSEEEDDLMHRSTKEIEEDASTVMDVEVQQEVNNQDASSGASPKMSYKDKVMEIDPKFDLQPDEIVRMVTEELFLDLDYYRNNVQEKKVFNPNPTVNVELEEYERWCTPWKYSLIVRLMGKRVGLRFMSLKLKYLWAKKGDVRVMDVSDDFFSQMVHVNDAPTLQSAPSQSKLDDRSDQDPNIHGQTGHPRKVEYRTHSLISKRKRATHQKDSQRKLEKNAGKKDTPQQTMNDVKEPTNLENQEAKNKDEWEREVMTLMSRYHNKRWEAYSRGDCVGDLWSMDKNNFLESVYGSSSGGVQGYMVSSDLDRPPDGNCMGNEDSNHDEL
ncbi:hypothetical protein SESBI_22478, partial [Sesbania bispinosa]